MLKQNQLKNIIILEAVVLILAATFLLSSFKETDAPPPLQEEAEEEKKEPEVDLPKVLYNLSGIIKSTGENFFVMEAFIPELDEDNQLVRRAETRKVFITSETKISRLTFVAGEEEGRRTPKETSITFSSLKAGDSIEVISKKDISKIEEFEAIKVRIRP